MEDKEGRVVWGSTHRINGKSKEDGLSVQTITLLYLENTPNVTKSLILIGN